MKELIEEFRLLATAAHGNHPGEWKDCRYAFCKRRHRLWLAAAVDDSDSKQAIAVARGELALAETSQPTPIRNISSGEAVYEPIRPCPSNE